MKWLLWPFQWALFRKEITVSVFFTFRKTNDCFDFSNDKGKCYFEGSDALINARVMAFFRTNEALCCTA